jgi:hypothetical protein
MSELKSKVQADSSISSAIDSPARCMILSLFYFELKSIPESINGKFAGIDHIQCSLHRKSLVFFLLLHRLLNCSAVFYLERWSR